MIGKHWLSHSFHQCNLLSREEPLTVLWPAVANTQHCALTSVKISVHMIHSHLVKHHNFFALNVIFLSHICNTRYDVLLWLD